MNVRKALGRAVLVILGAAVGLKAMDVAVGIADPCGISHFANHNLFTSTCVERRKLPPAGFEMDFAIPNSRAQANVLYQINSLGFRGREFSKDKPKDVWRILVLGDSVTFGWGVNVEDRFTDVVERRLADSRKDGPKVEILNLALPGYETMHEWYVFKTQALQLAPDAVIVAFNRNDVQNDTKESIDLQNLAKQRTASFGCFARLFVEEPWRSWFDRTLPNLRLLGVYRYVYSITENDAGVLTKQYAAMKEGIGISLKLLADMNKSCGGRSIPFGVADLHDVVPIRDGLQPLGVPYCSIAYGNDITDMSLRNSAVDPHPNAKGHRLLADKFEQALAKFHMLPPETH